MIETVIIFQLCFNLSEGGFEIKPKYYSFFNHFLFLTRVLSLQEVFLRNIFYFIPVYVCNIMTRAYKIAHKIFKMID